MKKVAKTIKEHLWGILNAIILKITNGPAKNINSRIKTIKVRSHGFLNKERFRNAIYFHPGGLDLYPKGIIRQMLPTQSGKEPNNCFILYYCRFFLDSKFDHILA